MVHSLERDPGNVILTDEPVTELSPKKRCPLRPDELAYQRLDLAGRLWGGRLEAPHVTLRQEPVAEAHPAQQDRLAVPVDNLVAVAVHEGSRGRAIPPHRGDHAYRSCSVGRIRISLIAMVRGRVTM